MRCNEGGEHVPPSAGTGAARFGGPGPRERLAGHRAGGWPWAARALRADPGSPRPQADPGENSREHRDGRPHHAVGKAAPLHVHGAAARAAELLLVRLGRRRRLHFRHRGRGWLPRQQKRRNPFRFRHAVRAPLRAAPAWSLISVWRHFREVGPPSLAFPPGIGVASLRACLVPGPSAPSMLARLRLHRAAAGGDALRPRAVLHGDRPRTLTQSAEGSLLKGVMQSLFIEHVLGGKHLIYIVFNPRELVRPAYLGISPRLQVSS